MHHQPGDQRVHRYSPRLSGRAKAAASPAPCTPFNKNRPSREAASASREGRFLLSCRGPGKPPRPLTGPASGRLVPTPVPGPGHAAPIAEDVGAGQVAHGRVADGGEQGGDLLGFSQPRDRVEFEVGPGLLLFQRPHRGVEVARRDRQHPHAPGPEPRRLAPGIPDHKILADRIGRARSGACRQQVHPGHHLFEEGFPVAAGQPEGPAGLSSSAPAGCSQFVAYMAYIEKSLLRSVKIPVFPTSPRIFPQGKPQVNKAVDLLLICTKGFCSNKKVAVIQNDHLICPGWSIWITIILINQSSHDSEYWVLCAHLSTAQQNFFCMKICSFCIWRCPLSF